MCSAGEVVSFASYMTGEIFALLAGARCCAKTLAADGWSERGLRSRRSRTASPAPSGSPARLFGCAPRRCSHGLAPERARARLSGLLIGAELAAARPYWLGRDVVLIGAPALADGLPRGARASPASPPGSPTPPR